MTKTAMIRARVEPELKSEAEEVLKQVGLSTTDLITMTLRQVVMRQGVPFDVRIPNAETIAAMEEVRNDRTEKRLPRYNSARELLDALEHEVDDGT